MEKRGQKMKFALCSDLHQYPIPNKPEADVLLIAGDISNVGTYREIESMVNYFKKLPYEKIILTAGNHDWGFQKNPENILPLFDDEKFEILINSHCEYKGFKFFGSPYCPKFGNWAFYPSEEIRKQTWNNIDNDTDIIITHCPPYRIMDKVNNNFAGLDDYCGCNHLRNRIMEIKPKIHLFGHIHEGYGKQEIDGITFINGSICTGRYNPINPVQVMEVIK